MDSENEKTLQRLFAKMRAVGDISDVGCYALSRDEFHSVQALLKDRSASSGDSASLGQRARELFDSMMDAAYGDTTIGHIVCAETTRGRLESAWLPLITAALANQQPAEAVVWVSESDLADSIARMKEDRPQVGWIRAFNSPDAANLGKPAIPLYTPPPRAIDIGKLRELAKWMRARADGGWTGKHQPVSASTLRVWAGTIEAALIGDGGGKIS